MTLWPPLFSMMLAATDLLGLRVHDVARVLNAGFFGALVLVAGLWSGRYLRLATRVIMCMTLVVSSALQLVARFAWSEPVFDLLLLGTLILAVEIARHFTWKRVVALGGLLAATTLTRYAGVVLIPTCIFALWLSSSGRRRLLALAVWGTVAAVPVTLWLLRNIALAGQPTGPRYQSAATFLGSLTQELQTFFSWFVPNLPRARVLIPMAAPLLVLAGSRGCLRDSRRRLWLVLIAFLSTAPLLLVLITLRVFGQDIDDRYMAPFFAPLVLLLAISADGLIDRMRRERRLPIGWALALVSGFALVIAPGVRYADGVGGRNRLPRCTVRS
jgi:hypothetical protein